MTGVASRIDGVWQRLLHWLLDTRHSTYGLAVMRIGFGSMTLVILALYLPNLSYSFGEGARWGEALFRASSANEYVWPISALFSRTDPDWLVLMKVGVLAIVALAYTLGWRMRVVSPLFVVLWLGFSSMNPVILNMGHYQTFRVMILFLLLADTSRRWSLDARRRRRHGEPRPLAVAGRSLPRWFPILTNNLAVTLIGAQLCIIYITSALWKLQGDTWITGVAVYYPLQLQELVLIPWLNDLVWHVTPLVFLASWASVYVQLLFPFALLNRWTRIAGLIVITGMHASIGILLALPWFSLVMIVSDMIFVRDSSWRAAMGWVRSRLASVFRAPRFRGQRGDARAPDAAADEASVDPTRRGRDSAPRDGIEHDAPADPVGTRTGGGELDDDAVATRGGADGLRGSYQDEPAPPVRS